MRNLILIPLLMLMPMISFCQAPQDITNGVPLTIDGVEYIYTLSMPTAKTIEGVSYSFYELKLEVTNLEKYSKIFLSDDQIKTHDHEVELPKRAYMANLTVRNGATLKDVVSNLYITADFNMQIITYVKGAFGIITKKIYTDGFNLEPGRTLNTTKTIATLNAAPPNVHLNLLGLSPVY